MPKLPNLVKPLSDREFTDQHLTTVPKLTEEAQRNLERATADLAAIFELKDHPAFVWFWKQVEGKFFAARTKLLAVDAPNETLPELKARYLAMREIYTFLIEREKTTRRQINPNDAEITKLEQKLALL